MEFTISRKLSNLVGASNDIFWCNYLDDPNQYVCKRLRIPGLSLQIELEAARRLVHLPTVYKVKGIESKAGIEWLVSEYVPGEHLSGYKDDLTINLFIHIMCTLEEMSSVGICHNNILSKHIIVSPSDERYVRYTIKGERVYVRVFGFIPVILNFGLSRIEGFDYKPVINGFSSGNLGSLIGDVRFDALAVVRMFTELLQGHCKCVNLRDFFLQEGKEKMMITRNLIFEHVSLIWEFGKRLKRDDYPSLFDPIEYEFIGLLMSFPVISYDGKNRVKELVLLDKMYRECTRNEFLMRCINSLKTGPSDPTFAGFCVLSRYLWEGVDEFLKVVVKDVPESMMPCDWVTYAMDRYPKNFC